MIITPCRPWSGRVNADGYGTFGPDLAHRLAWEREHGEIPDGLTIDHVCHDPTLCLLGVNCPHRRCVETMHMRLITGSENARRGCRPQRDRTRCPAGHPYTAANTLTYQGRRTCRACKAAREAVTAHARKIARCATAGHARASAFGIDGREFCTTCMTAQAARASAVRWRKRLVRL